MNVLSDGKIIIIIIENKICQLLAMSTEVTIQFKKVSKVWSKFLRFAAKTEAFLLSQTFLSCSELSAQLTLICVAF